MRATFGASAADRAARRRPAPSPALATRFDAEGATVVIVDLDASRDDEMQALERLMHAHRRRGRRSWWSRRASTPTWRARCCRCGWRISWSSRCRRSNWCAPARAWRTPAATETNEAQIYTFLPAVGGAGVTTLAIQTALLLLNSGQRGRASTCLVDLDFQHGACADYLDLEPRLDLDEIEPRPERLDRQLLEVMLSHHRVRPCGDRGAEPARPRCARSIRTW